MLSSPVVSYFCDWAVCTLSGGEQLGVQHPAEWYSSSPIFRPASIVAGLCSRPFLNILSRKNRDKRRFKMYVDDIVCTVKRNPLDYLEYAKSLHKNLQFTLETPNDSGDLAFLDLNKKVNQDCKISCHWYLKLNDTGMILIFNSGAAIQHSKNVIGATVHSIFNAISEWQSFDVSRKKNQKIWKKNQYPTEWSSSIVNKTSDKLFKKEKFSTKSPQKEQSLKKVKSLNKKEI